MGFDKNTAILLFFTFAYGMTSGMGLVYFSFINPYIASLIVFTSLAFIFFIMMYAVIERLERMNEKKR